MRRAEQVVDQDRPLGVYVFGERSRMVQLLVKGTVGWEVLTRVSLPGIQED